MDKYQQAVAASQEIGQLKNEVQVLTRLDMQRAKERAILVRKAEKLHHDFPAIVTWDEIGEVFGVSRITIMQWRKDAAALLGPTAWQ